MTVAIEVLAEMPLFRRVPTHARRVLAQAVEPRELRRGDVLYRTGEPGSSVFVVRRGAVEVFVENGDGKKLILRTAKAGDVFGNLSVADPRPRPSTATALEDASLIELDREDLRVLFAHSPEAALEILEAAGQETHEADSFLCGQGSRNANDAVDEQDTLLGRMADRIASFSGSMPFLLLNAAWFFVWIVSNTVPGLPRFDPFPFGLLTMIVSLEAIFLSIFVLISQNRQAHKDRIRAEIDYQVNVRAELEISFLHEKQDRFRAEVLEHLGALREISGTRRAS